MNGMSQDNLQRYLVMREKVDAQLNEIQVMSCLLGYYKGCCQDNIGVDLHALGHVHVTMHRQVLDIAEELEVFLSLYDAKVAMGELRLGPAG